MPVSCGREVHLFKAAYGYPQAGLYRAMRFGYNISSSAPKKCFARGEHALCGRAIVEQARATLINDRESNGALRGHYRAVDHCAWNMCAWDEVGNEYG